MREALKAALRTLGLFDDARFLRDVVADYLPAQRAETARMCAFYREFMGSGDLCFDVGANLGNRSRVFLKLGARVVAVEPHPYCVRVLRLKYRRSRRFRLVSKAVGSEPGWAELQTGKSHTISTLSTEWRKQTVASGRWKPEEWSERVKVEVTTLDELIETYGLPRFCKIDVEGSEFEGLRGLSAAVPQLSFEFTAPEETGKAVACVERLESLGKYAYTYSLCESLVLEHREWTSATELCRTLAGLTEPDSWGDVYARLE